MNGFIGLINIKIFNLTVIVFTKWYWIILFQYIMNLRLLDCIWNEQHQNGVS